MKGKERRLQLINELRTRQTLKRAGIHQGADAGAAGTSASRGDYDEVDDEDGIMRDGDDDEDDVDVCWVISEFIVFQSRFFFEYLFF
jgi:hypothetical protein